MICTRQNNFQCIQHVTGLLFFLVVHTCFTGLISFYNNVICLACEDKVADVVSWIFVRLWGLSLLHPSGQVVQLWHEQDAKGCNEFGYVWLVMGYQQCSSGSVLVLFKKSLSDLEAWIECPISRFADHVKQGGAVDSVEGQGSLQRDEI